MARVIVEFDIDNAAFEDDFEGEVQKVMDDAIGDILNWEEDPTFLFDSNGNNVGEVRIEEEESDEDVEDD